MLKKIGKPIGSDIKIKATYPSLYGIDKLIVLHINLQMKQRELQEIWGKGMFLPCYQIICLHVNFNKGMKIIA